MEHRQLAPDPAISDEEREAVVAAVREFVNRDVIPGAGRLERADEFPDALVDRMTSMGLFGLTILEEHGGAGMDLLTYALVVEELSRGWMSLAGVLNSHFIGAHLIDTYGTDEQRHRFLPRMSAGSVRAALSMSEPAGGSDVQSITCRAVRDDASGEYLVTGQKMWVTNGLRAGMVMLLCVTDPGAEPRHRGISMLIVEKEPGARDLPGLAIPPNIDKLGYRGVETTELVFDGFRVPSANLLGGLEGHGFAHAMDGIEVGRVNIAARAVGMARRAFDESIRYAQTRRTFGKPIAEHQAIAFMLADMATKLEAGRLMMIRAAERKSSGARADLEAGMAKLFCSEMCLQVVTDALRVHGGYGYSAEYPIERLYRDAPLLVVGEGTNEIQRLVIARQLLERHRLVDGGTA